MSEVSNVGINYQNKLNSSEVTWQSWNMAACENLPFEKSDCGNELFGLGSLGQTASTLHLNVIKQNIEAEKERKLRFLNPLQEKPKLSSLPQSRLISEAEQVTCLCYESLFISQIGSEVAAKQLIEAKEKELSQDVLKAFGKKFINDYAHLYEDGIYFINHTNVVSAKNSKKLLCRGADRYEKAVAKRCPNKDSAEIKSRIDIMLSSIDFGSEAGTLAEKLRYVDLNTIRRKSKDKDGNELTYLRTEYDKTRYGLKTSEDFQSLDRVLTNLFKRDDFYDLQEKNFFKGGLEVLTMYLSDRFVRDFDGALADIFGDNPPSKKIIEEWREIKNGPNARIEFVARFGTYLLKSAPTHPGLAGILLEPGLFKDFVKQMRKSKSQSIYAEFENNFTKLEDYLEKRCEDMTASFAEVACLENTEIIRGLSKGTLANFMAEKAMEDIGPLKEGINSVLSCRGDNNPVVAFHDLNPNGSKILNSDFYGSMESKNKEQGDVFSALAHSVANDEEARELISAAADVSNKNPKRKSGYDVLTAYSDSFSKDHFISANGTILAIKNKNNEQVEIPNVEDKSHSISSTSSGSFLGDINLAPEQPQVGHKFEMISSVDSNELYNSLSHREDKEVISRHISQLDSEDIKDLRDFKKNILEDKENVLKLKLEEEQKNLERLKVQIDNFTSGKTVIEEAAKSNKTSVDIKNLRDDNSFERRVVVSETLNDRPAFNRTDQRINSAVSGASVGGTLLASAGAATLSGGIAANSGASRGIASLPAAAELAGREPASAPKGLVVNAHATAPQNKQEITQRVVEYLKGADTETFLQFTKEGVTYQYKTLENGVLVEKEVHISLDDVDPELLAELIKESESKLNIMQRKYSYDALKIIISEETLKL